MVEGLRRNDQLTDELSQAREVATGSDADMKALADDEMDGLERELATIEEQIKILLVPKDPNDDRNVVLEIRAGTGGDEAALFAADLFRMYSRYAERRGWKVDAMSMSDTGRRPQGSHRLGRRQGRLSVSSSTRAECIGCSGPRDRSQRTHPHLDGDGRGPSRSRGSRRPDRSEGSARRYVLFERSWRTKRQHDLLGRPRDAPPHRRRRVATGREVADQEPRKGDEGASLAAVRDGAAQAAGRDCQGTARPGRHGRAIREDSHLQLQGKPDHGSPHQLHDAPAHRALDGDLDELIAQAQARVDSDKLKQATETDTVEA